MPPIARMRALPLFALLALNAAPPAVAAEPGFSVVDGEKWSLSVPAAKRSDCRSGAISRRAVATRSYRAPVAGVLQARLRGADRSDWDLVVVDAASGRTLGASLGFGAREVVSVPLAGADRVLLRACRRVGRASRARLAVTHAALPALHGPTKLSLVEVGIRSPLDQERLTELGFDTADHSDGRTLKIVLHGKEQATELLRAGFPFRTLVEDLAVQDRRDRAAERRSELAGARSPLPSGRTGYRTLADHQADLKALAEQHPDRVRGFVLPGTSLEGREISGVEIAADVRRSDDGRPHVYIDGVNHAREWPAGEIPAEFAIDLVKNPSRDPRLAGILNDARTFVVPIVNVDGFEVSRTAGVGVFETANFGDLPWAATGAGAAYKRKNCRFADQTPPRVPCLVTHLAHDMGVDTNRNYGFGWGGPGATTTTAQMTYRGPAAFSEPETTALRRFMFTIQPTMVVSNHTVAALMLRPPGQKQTPDTPDEAPMKALGDAMGDQTGYKSERSWELYDTTGTTIDWTYGALAAWSYTPELGGRGFHGPYAEHVVDQYEGKGGERGGMRAALILAAQAGIDPKSHSVIAGSAPAGRTLRVTRTFVTKTWGGDPLEPDTHSSSITVADSGRFEWAVTPSRRPYETEGRWTLTCEREGVVLETREVAVERGQRATIDLGCGGAASQVQPPSTETPSTDAPSCATPLRSLRVRPAGPNLEVLYRRAGRGRVTVELLRGSKRVRSARGGTRGAKLKRTRQLANGRYSLRVTLVDASGRRDVHTIAIAKKGRRIRAGKGGGGCG